ncbi:MAG: ElyC/SanA/YdcF family protein [Cyanobacteria bacterium J06638_28]
MVLTLLTRILVWAAVGLIIWYLLKSISRKFLAWFGGAIILALIVLAFIDPNDQTIGAIWKVISLPLTPLGFAVGLLGFSISDGLNKVKGRQVAIALTILIICSVPLVSRAIVDQAERAVERAYETQRGICDDVCPAEIPTDVPLGSVSTIVLLGENMDVVALPDEFPSRVDSGISLDPILVSRLNSTAALYDRLRRNGSAPFVFVTAGPIYGNADERADKERELRQVLVNNGIPANAIRIEDSGMDVHRAMRQVRSFLSDRNLLDDADTPQRTARRVALVAPALSMRRAALTFEEGGMQVIAWPTNLYGSSEPTGDTLARLSDLVPSVEALRLTTRYWDEVLTSFYYFLRGWLPGFDVRWNEIVELVPET